MISQLKIKKWIKIETRDIFFFTFLLSPSVMKGDEENNVAIVYAKGNKALPRWNFYDIL